MEIVGGGFYEPILVVIPSEDRLEQITRLAGYIEKHFGRRPKGAWLAERVWEPQLPSSLGAAGVEYTLVDDNHFLGAGFELEQLFGYFTAEDQCHSVKVLPGLESIALPDSVPRGGGNVELSTPGGFASIRAVSPPWVMTWRNSAFGPEHTIFAIAMAGSKSFLLSSNAMPHG